jgi:hypothetical protein
VAKDCNPGSTMGHMPAIAESIRSPVILRLLDHAGEDFPQVGNVQARYREAGGRSTGVTPGGDSSSASARFAS